MNTRKAAAEWQKDRGCTDADMARLINVSRATWSRFKHAQCNLTADNERALNAVMYGSQTPNMLPQLKKELQACIEMIDDSTLNKAFVWTRCLNIFKTYIFADSIPVVPNQAKEDSSEWKGG